MAHKGIHNLSYGMYLLTAREDGKDYGCIVNTAMQVSSAPDRIAVCIVKSNKTHEILLRTSELNLCAIKQDAPFDFFKKFGLRSSRKVDKFADIPGISRSANGLVYLPQFVNMYLSVQIEQQIDLGDHTLFIGKVMEDVVLSDTLACTYDYYIKNIKPKNK